MLAVFYDRSGCGLTIHRTYITQDGSDKLGIEKPRRILPSLGKMQGGAVRLFQYDDVLGIAEGVETAIAAHEIFGIPVWAALNTSLLAAFDPPDTVKKLIVFCDNDINFAGQYAGFSLAHRIYTTRHMEVDVKIPRLPGEDFLDQLNRCRL
jgi:putative DNA primase/helicase